MDLNWSGFIGTQRAEAKMVRTSKNSCGAKTEKVHGRRKHSQIQTAVVRGGGDLRSMREKRKDERER